MIPRLYLKSDLAPGMRIALTGDQSHYLQNVLRRKHGDDILVFNGRQGEFFARLEAVSKRQANISICSLNRPQQEETDLWLCHAPLQRRALEYLIEKATELGTARFLPVITQYSGPHRINLARLEAIAREAAEQTERLTVPYFAEPMHFENMLQNWPKERRLILCAEASDTVPLAEFLHQDPKGPFAVMTGPEGGYAERELDLAAKFPFVTPVGLGPRILRAETASLAALAIFQAIKGDGKEKSPRPVKNI